MGKQPEDGALILASELEKHAEVLPGHDSPSSDSNKGALILASESEEHVQILPGHDDSSSDSNDEKCKEPGRPIKTAVRPREIKAAAEMLWRQRLTLGVIVAGATILIWFLSETLGYCLLGYYLLEHICTMFFVWSEPSVFINRQPPHIPRISFSKLFRDVASVLIFEIDRLFAFPVIVDDASGRDWKKFLMVVTGLWFLSVACRWDAFLSLFYYVVF